MGKFDKFKRMFVEENNQEEDYSLDDLAQSEDAIVAEDVNVNIVNKDTVIAEIYQANQMEDMSESIFKVEEIMLSLPKEMTKATKQSTVIAILNSFQLTPDGVVEDGKNRLELLNSAFLKIQGETNEKIDKNSTIIEEHKQAIELLEKEIAENESFLKQASDAIDYENERINELIHFVKEGNK